MVVTVDEDVVLLHFHVCARVWVGAWFMETKKSTKLNWIWTVCTAGLWVKERTPKHLKLHVITIFGVSKMRLDFFFSCLRIRSQPYVSFFRLSSGFQIENHSKWFVSIIIIVIIVALFALNNQTGNCIQIYARMHARPLRLIAFSGRYTHCMYKLLYCRACKWKAQEV